MRLTALTTRSKPAVGDLCVGLFVVAALAGCTEPKSTTCRAVCSREAECRAEQATPDLTFDETACVADCSVLERDAVFKERVVAYAKCVAVAADCAAVLQCQ